MTDTRGGQKLPVSVLIAARNEEKNIRRCLGSLAPAREVVLVDSGSSDNTATIARDEFGARVVQFKYPGGYPKKRQWAVDHLELAGDWVVLLDADEVVPEGLWQEIGREIDRASAAEAYLVRKGFHFLGRRFRFGGFSHQAVFLLRKGRGRFEELVWDSPLGLDMEVHERVIIDGRIGTFSTPLIHEDFKGLEAYLDRHNKYSTWEAELRRQYLQKGEYGRSTIAARWFGNAQERRRALKRVVMRMPFEATIWFLYHYLLRLGILEGRPGYVASRLRAQYIFQVRIKMRDLG